MATLVVDPATIAENARRVASRVDGDLVFVAKAVESDPSIVEPALRHVDGIGDTRIAPLERYRGVDVETVLIAPIIPARAPAVAEAVDCSLQAERDVIERIADADADHDVVVMVDVGIGREGLDPATAVDLATESVVAGVGATVGCDREGRVDDRAFAAFTAVAERLAPTVVSVGGSVVLGMDLPDIVTRYRIGEAILLGTDPATGRRIDWLADDAFLLRAEVVRDRGNRQLVDVGYTHVSGAHVERRWADLSLVDARPAGLGDEVRLPVDYRTLCHSYRAPDVDVVDLRSGEVMGPGAD